MIPKRIKKIIPKTKVQGTLFINIILAEDAPLAKIFITKKKV